MPLLVTLPDFEALVFLSSWPDFQALYLGAVVGSIVSQAASWLVRLSAAGQPTLHLQQQQ